MDGLGSLLWRAGRLGPVLAILLPLAAAGPARAADRAAAASIAACLDRARAAESDSHGCIGILSRPCLARAEDPSTAGMVACIAREHEVWDDLLNGAYQTLMRRLEPEQARKLKAAQRAWIEARELACGFYQVYFEGTMAVPMGADCINTQTADRFFFLEAFVQDLPGAGMGPR